MTQCIMGCAALPLAYSDLGRGFRGEMGIEA